MSPSSSSSATSSSKPLAFDCSSTAFRSSHTSLPAFASSTRRTSSIPNARPNPQEAYSLPSRGCSAPPSPPSRNQRRRRLLPPFAHRRNGADQARYPQRQSASSLALAVQCAERSLREVKAPRPPPTSLPRIRLNRVRSAVSPARRSSAISTASSQAPVRRLVLAMTGSSSPPAPLLPRTPSVASSPPTAPPLPQLPTQSSTPSLMLLHPTRDTNLRFSSVSFVLEGSPTPPSEAPSSLTPTPTTALSHLRLWRFRARRPRPLRSPSSSPLAPARLARLVTRPRRRARSLPLEPTSSINCRVHS